MASTAMQQIMKANLIEDLGHEVEKTGSYLQKVAFRIGQSSDPEGLGDALQAAMFVAEKDPNRGQALLDLLDQYAQQSIQTALEKIVTESGDQSSLETDRIGRMSDLLRARIQLGREQMTLTRVQRDLAEKMGLSGQNPATAATGQMPTPIAGGAPPMPMQPPGQMPGQMPSQMPMPQPPQPQMPGQKPGMAPPPKKGGPQLPGSPMEAAAL
jgi:hypothetical protein